MIRTFFAAALSFAAFTPLFASALSPAQPSLIRAPGSSAVYYALPDGRRYTFPNERIYRSWYSDFSAVQSVSNNELASYQLAGAVVYHPGQLIKITTDPKVYAVTEGGVLRWLETETVARRAAGTSWASLVHDLPDELFPAYTIGAPVRESDTAFSLAPLLTSSADIRANQRLSGQPTPSSTTPVVPPPTTPTTAPSITMRTSDSRGILPADTMQISVFGNGQVPENTRISVNNLLVQSCTKSPSCSYTLTHPLQSTIEQYTVSAEGLFSDGTRATQTLSIPVRDAKAGALRVVLSNTQGRTNTPVDVRAEWKDSLVGAQRVLIMIDGQDQKICFDTTLCTLSFPLTKAAGQTHTVLVYVDDTSGKRWVSPTSTVQVVTNETPALTAGVNASTLYVGEMIQVNAQASDDDVVTNLSIWRNGERVASCTRSQCSYVSEPTTTAKEERFRITATDSQGNTAELALDPIVILPRLTP